MKLVWRGDYKSEEDLPKADLPENAVQFKEPETPAKVNLAASAFILPVLVIVGLAMVGKVMLYGGFEMTGVPWVGFLLAFVAILPHEAIHAVCFPKGSTVYLFTSLKNGMAFVVCPEQMSKARFIFLSLAPNLLFGLLPLLLWVFLPIASGAVSVNLFTFALMSLSCGVGDFMNVWNAARQMPRGSVTALSGFHSYWWMPAQAQQTFSAEG